MFKLSNKFVVCAMVASFVNLVMIAMCGLVIRFGIYFIMPLHIYTADQYMHIALFLTLGSMALANAFLIKAGLYRTIKNHVED